MISPYLVKEKSVKHKSLLEILDAIDIYPCECVFLELDGEVVGYRPDTDRSKIKMKEYKDKFKKYEQNKK